MASMDEFPDHIIDHIVSFLSYKHATKASVLSTSWLNSWKSRPTTNLVFDFNDFFPLESEEVPPCCWDIETSNKRNKEFSEYVGRTLDKCVTVDKTGIDDFSLTAFSEFERYSQWDSPIERCLEAAVESGVKKLFVHLSGRELDPKVFLDARSLEDGTLWDLKLVEETREIIKGFDRLKRLCLRKVKLDHVTLERMISCCSQSIEFLEIDFCEGYGFRECTDMPDLHRLMNCRMKLSTGQHLILHEAPNLESLLICSGYKTDLSVDVDDWESCWESYDSCSLDMRSSQYKNLKSMVLHAVDNCDKVLFQMEEKFPNLEDLTIQYCGELKGIKIKSHSLKTLKLVNNLELKEAQFDTPSIVEFIFASNESERESDVEFKGENTIPALTFVAASSHWTSDISIAASRNDLEDISWFLKLQSLLASLVRSKHISLTLELDARKISFDINEIRDKLASHEPQEVDELSLDIDRKKTSLSSKVVVLDLLFSVCRPKTLRHGHCGKITKGKYFKTFKLLYDMLILRKDQEKFHNLPELRYFWVENLKGAKVGILKGNQREQQLETLKWENLLEVLKSTDISDFLISQFELEWRSSVKNERPKRKAVSDKCEEELRISRKRQREIIW